MSVVTSDVDRAGSETRLRAVVWGMSAADLHDAYWESLGVSVVRPGGQRALRDDAGLYLMVGAGCMVLLDFRKVLNVMGWQPTQLSILRLRMPAGDVCRRGTRNGELFRCAFTPSFEIAEAWRLDDGSHGAWRRRKENLDAARFNVIRSLGREYADGSGMKFLERLSQVWLDPRPAVAGLEKICPRVFGLKGSDGTMGKRVGDGRRIWLGRGRSLAEITDESMCVLADSE